MSDPHEPQIQSSRSPPPGPASSSSDSSSTATANSNNNNNNDGQPLSPILDQSEPAIESTTAPQSAPSNDAIEAAIQAAINAGTSRSSPSVAGPGKGGGDGRTVPPRDTRTQLFVGNLPYRVRWQDLKDLFRRAGTVLRADVSLGADNRSRGYGTVLLATAEDAGRAIDMFNGYEWQARMLEVRVDRIGGPMSGGGVQRCRAWGVQSPNDGGVASWVLPLPHVSSEHELSFEVIWRKSGRGHGSKDSRRKEGTR
ncbi:hypothetical protein NMY22_g14903 [Coprinellus aureogranulatus]|nr:hypothetical protein NMY22_g14903 [Coprinellus aureogranulatus]